MTKRMTRRGLRSPLHLKRSSSTPALSRSLSSQSTAESLCLLFFHLAVDVVLTFHFSFSSSPPKVYLSSCERPLTEHFCRVHETPTLTCTTTVGLIVLNFHFYSKSREKINCTKKHYRQTHSHSVLAHRVLLVLFLYPLALCTILLSRKCR